MNSIDEVNEPIDVRPVLKPLPFNAKHRIIQILLLLDAFEIRLPLEIIWHIAVETHHLIQLVFDFFIDFF
jgi:hypothetical protein